MKKFLLNKIAEQFGTPTYVYSKKFFTDRYKEFDEAFKDIKHKIFFALKSNFNLSVIKLFSELGAGLDVNSEGEFYRAHNAGISPQKMIFSGVGKTVEEIKLGIEKEVIMLKAESVEEIYVINEIAKSLGKIAPVAIRVNPDVDAETHPYISTGLAENKFGVGTEDALSIFREFKNLSNIKFTGIDMHIGSQITKVTPYVSAVEKLAELFFQLKSEGLQLEHFDMGGGIGVVYKDENPFPIKDLANAVIPILQKLDCEVFFEPGRFLTANGGVLLTKILYTKKNHGKNFIVVDGAMTDLLRPSIYGAYHHIQPVDKNEGAKEITTDIVGPVCESGDFLAKKRDFVECKRNDHLAVMSGGAYGMAMASNYNGRRRPAEILIDGDKISVVRSRETFDYLLFDEVEKL